jgi:lipid-A-disaccharide synthase-like uncharacterized protein
MLASRLHQPSNTLTIEWLFGFIVWALFCDGFVASWLCSNENRNQSLNFRQLHRA